MAHSCPRRCSSVCVVCQLRRKPVWLLQTKDIANQTDDVATDGVAPIRGKGSYATKVRFEH
jgi:hypothetical protein